MAYMTEDFSCEIERIIREFQDEMSKIEAANLFVTPYRTNPLRQQETTLSKSKRTARNGQTPCAAPSTAF